MGSKGKGTCAEAPVQLEAPFDARALAAGPGGRRARLFLSPKSGNVNSEIVIEFLRNLRRHIRRNVVLLRDRLPAHRSKTVAQFLHSQRRWLSVEYLPAYAPELNPVELVWAYLSATDLANYGAEGLDDLARTVKRGIQRLRRKHNSGNQFLRHCGLF